MKKTDPADREIIRSDFTRHLRVSAGAGSGDSTKRLESVVICPVGSNPITRFVVKSGNAPLYPSAATKPPDRW